MENSSFSKNQSNFLKFLFTIFAILKLVSTRVKISRSLALLDFRFAQYVGVNS